MNRFSGGDSLEGIEKVLHEVLMLTELNNGYGAYQISYAGGNSGLSFGGNQMDLSNGSVWYFELFRDIMENSGVMNPAEVRRVTEYEKVVQKGVRPELAFGDLLDKVNMALSSPYGIRKINEAYVREIRGIVRHVRGVVLAMSNVENRLTILNNQEFMVRLMDYHNQFSLHKNGKLISLLNGMQEAPKTLDIAIFISSTKQYNKSASSARALENRLLKLENYFNRQKEKKYETTR